MNTPMGQQPIPNATAVLVLGILSIVGCFCYGVVGIILGIIALVLAKKGKDAYAINPESYTAGSLSNINAGRTCAIIGLILSAILIIFYAVLFAVVGTEVLGDPEALREALENLQ